MKRKPMHKFRTVLTVFESFFTSWRFPLFTLSVLLFFAMLVLALALIPVSDSGIGTFAEEFKIWCLGYDPATGEMESMYLVMFLVQPLILSLFIVFFWYQPLTGLLKKQPRKSIIYILAALSLVAAIGVTLPSLYSAGEKEELPFPAERLRTRITPPGFTLINQYKETVSLEDYRGKIIMITAVYASCSETCPLILEQSRQVLEELGETQSGQVQLMALTMDPGKDTPMMLRMTADHYGLPGPNRHLLTGEPSYINTILDRLNIPRKRREDGAIDHANIFILIDKAGHVAYRFTLGERQKKWLLKATRLLINEPAPTLNVSQHTSSNF